MRCEHTAKPSGISSCSPKLDSIYSSVPATGWFQSPFFSQALPIQTIYSEHPLGTQTLVRGLWF